MLGAQNGIAGKNAGLPIPAAAIDFRGLPRPPAPLPHRGGRFFKINLTLPELYATLV